MCNRLIWSFGSSRKLEYEYDRYDGVLLLVALELRTPILMPLEEDEGCLAETLPPNKKPFFVYKRYRKRISKIQKSMNKSTQK